MRRLVLALVLVAAASACRDVLLTDPAPAEPVVLDLAPLLLTGPADATVEDALADATDIHVRIVVEGASGSAAVLVDRTVRLDVSGGSPVAQLEIPLERASVDVVGNFVVLHEGDPLFSATQSFTLRQGERTEVSPVLDPEVASVDVSPVPTVTSLGATVAIEATALYATGGVIDGATYSYVSSDPSVLQHQGGNLFQAVGEGTTTVTVTAAAGPTEIDTSGNSGSTGVTVAAEVHELEVTPTSLDIDVGESATVQATARDAGGNALDRTITFESDAPSVASVSSTGAGTAQVTGESQGSTTVRASFGEHSVEVPVDVTQILGTGDVQVTLTWDNTADLDLHVTEPSGETIWFGNTTSATGGTLDVDDQNGEGPENIFWPEGGAPEGTYTVQVHHFSGPSPSAWEVTVLTPDGTETYQGSITTDQMVTVTTFTVGPATSTCPVQGTITAGQEVFGTLSVNDCTHPNLPSGEVSRVWTFVPGGDAVRMELVEGSADVSLWRGGPGTGGRAGIALASWGATILHLNSDASYTLTVEGAPGTSFHLGTMGTNAHEVDQGNEIIQWSEPVTGIPLVISEVDPVGPSDEHEDFHGIWPKPGEVWEVSATSEGLLRRRSFNDDPDEIDTTVGVTVDGSTYSVAGHVFFVASYGNEVPQNYTFSISQSSSSAPVRSKTGTGEKGASPAASVVGSGGR